MNFPVGVKWSFKKGPFLHFSNSRCPNRSNWQPEAIVHHLQNVCFLICGFTIFAAMHTTDWIVLLFILAIVTASIVFRKLTVAGALTGGIMAGLLYKGAGITGIVMLGAFFVAGTAA